MSWIPPASSSPASSRTSYESRGAASPGSASIRTRIASGSPARNCSRGAPSGPASETDDHAGLAAPPLAQAGAALGRVALVGEQAVVGDDRLVRRAVELDASGLEEDGPVAEPLDRRRVVRDEDDRAAALLELEDLAEALALELLVADREHLVEQEHVRLDVGRDREAEPHRHPRGVGADGEVDEALEPGEGDDLVHQLPDRWPA